ncbi:MAG: VCBS repeat-containing protein [Gammaproteobacteria bacterium]|nr:VCBS repeat-containing protein [Gammaproteobacteria bacterium]MDP2141470.1 VCBS repeat-containing protein [Gammaproteobacteria bacterium]MDP2347505.1 VCBS repeat-containing protein [Gammaproteobacteria bacterium]
MPTRHTPLYRIARYRVQLICCFSLLLSACQAADAQRFDRLVLDDAFAGGYGVEIADVDGDGRMDIVALATNPAQFVWYRNPGWEKYIISSTAAGNIAAASHDIDGDGDMDIVLASAFNLRASTEGGLVHWLENPGNPMENQEWQQHLIDQIPTSHRLRWADVNGDGKSELINLPIIGIGATEPDYAVGARLTAYSIPQDPRAGRWGKVVISDALEMAHGLSVIDWNGDGRDDLLTASFSGIDLFQMASRGRMVDQTPLGAGNRGNRPGQGSSEVAVGSLAGQPEGSLESSARFLASIEPWHGNEVVVYRPNEDGSLPWAREVIDTELVGGHALVVADLNNDGRDEIIAGHRSSPFGLYIYRYMPDTGLWQRSTLDAGGIGVAGLAVSDFNGDGFADIVAVGSSTANVVLFENAGR